MFKLKGGKKGPIICGVLTVVALLVATGVLIAGRVLKAKTPNTVVSSFIENPETETVEETEIVIEETIVENENGQTEVQTVKKVMNKSQAQAYVSQKQQSGSKVYVASKPDASTSMSVATPAPTEETTKPGLKPSKTFSEYTTTKRTRRPPKLTTTTIKKATTTIKKTTKIPGKPKNPLP